MAKFKVSSGMISSKTYSVTKELNRSNIWPFGTKGKLRKDHSLLQTIFKNK